MTRIFRKLVIAFGALLVMAFSTIVSSACSPERSSTNAAATPSEVPATPSPAATATGTAGSSVPTPLADAGEFGENVYDYAKANDWKNADARLAALRTSVKELRTLIPKQSAELDRLEEDVLALDHAVAARDQRAAMRAANQVTRDVADMTARYALPVPVEVTRLDYYGRELEIWAEAKDAEKMRETARAMRRGWDAVRSAVETRSAAEAEKFGALVAQVEKARTPAEFARLAKLVLDEVDNLEKVFQP
jgi:hypothetical protein